MPLLWDDRLPFLGSDGRKKIVERTLACSAQIAEQIGVPEAAIRKAKLLGCGNFGCTLLVRGLPRDRSVIKVTSDNLEANAAARILAEDDHLEVKGLVKIHKVFRLGNCSVLPRMQPLSYTRRDVERPFGVSRRELPKVFYRGPGAPYRPLWVIQREELDDAWPHLKALGVKKSKADDNLYTIWWGGMLQTSAATSFGKPQRWMEHDKLTPEQIDAAARRVHGHALVEAMEWLIERDMSWLDMRKLVNLGWRRGVGLVIRDVGFTASGVDVLGEIKTVGSTYGRRP